MTFPRRKLLGDLRRAPKDFNPKDKPQKWAIEQGYAVEGGGRLSITQRGADAIDYEALPVEAKAAKKLLPRLRGKTLVRTSSTTEEARNEGNGYLYFTEPDRRPFPTVSGRVLIERGWLSPAEDGLFAGFSQTFRVPSHA